MVKHKVVHGNELVISLEDIIEMYEAKGWEVAAFTYSSIDTYTIVFKRYSSEYAYDSEYAHSLAAQGIS